MQFSTGEKQGRCKTILGQNLPHRKMGVEEETKAAPVHLPLLWRHPLLQGLSQQIRQ